MKFTYAENMAFLLIFCIRGLNKMIWGMCKKFSTPKVAEGGVVGGAKGGAEIGGSDVAYISFEFLYGF